MGISVKIAGVDRTEYVDARSLVIIDEVTNKASSAHFNFSCQDIAVAPVAGASVLIEEGATKLFSGRVLFKIEAFLPPALLSYNIECIDNTRDLDKYLVVESYVNQKGGDIIKHIVDNYTTGFTYANVQDGPTLTYISFDHIQASDAIAMVARACGYYWYIDWDKDLYFFLKTDYPAAFGLDDDQDHHKELVINFDVSQLRNRVYVKSSKYETLDFTELFVGDGATVTWTCKYTPNALPAPSLKLDGVAKTVGWFGVDDPDLFDFMLNAGTGVLSLGTFEGTPVADEEIVITFGADVPIIISWDDAASIAAVAAIEGGDGIFEYCITNNNVDTKEWAMDLAKADLLVNANPVITGSFLTNEKTIRSGQIITLNSVKRGITQDFLVQKVVLERVDVVTEYPKVPYKPAAIAVVGYKPAATAEVPYRGLVGGEVIYYLYRVTIATKLKGLEDLLLELLYNSSESLKRDTTAPAVPTSLALTTGMGEITQAGLTWLKAAWDANTEVDFDHYELKYKKTAYTDFGLVTTTDTTFLWVGLEQNIEYQVYIRGVDIYGNRSAWSGVQTQTTTTDTDAPAQIVGQVATPIMAGIKVEWTQCADSNIAYYLVERQESNDGTTWAGAWTERTRMEGDLWLDLLLTYIKFYRYRITAYSQTGTAGVTSGVTADSIAPLQVGANDIVAGSITADQIAVNTIIANNYLELRNTYVFNGDDSLDNGFPYEFDFQIVAEMTAIVSVKLSFRIKEFRAYTKAGAAQATPSGGGATSGNTGSASGGGATSGPTGSASGGAETSGADSSATSIPANWAVGDPVSIDTWPMVHSSSFAAYSDSGGAAVEKTVKPVTHRHDMAGHTHSTPNHTHPNHTHTTPDHTHPNHSHSTPAHTHPNHQHSTPNHTHPNHTHTAVYGIFEDATSPTIHYHIDNGAGYGGASGNFNSDQLDIAITGSITTVGLKKIRFDTNLRCRIVAWIMCKIDITA